MKTSPKKFPFKNAQFVGAAYTEEQLPSLASSTGKKMAEIAIVGRSNVGKSSLINHLLNNKSLAKVSSTPGKTQSINFFVVDDAVALVDLPGYGYAKISKTIREQWGELIERYLLNRLNLTMILFLIDSRRTPTPEDQAMLDWAVHHKKPILLIFTKADKLSEQEKKDKTLHSLKTLGNSLHTTPVQFIHYSIKNPHARMELIDKINGLLEHHGTHQ